MLNNSQGTVIIYSSSIKTMILLIKWWTEWTINAAYNIKWKWNVIECDGYYLPSWIITRITSK